MNSLQARLIAGGATVVALGFLLAGFAVYALSRSATYNEFDESLVTKVQTLAALTKETSDGVHFDLAEGIQAFNRRDVLSYYQVWHDDEVLARSPELARDQLLASGGSLMRPSFQSLHFADGRPVRQVCVTFEPTYQADEDDDEYEDDDDDEDEDDDDHDERENDHEREWRPNRSGLFSSDETDLEAATNESGVVTLAWERAAPQVTIAVARETGEIEESLANLRWTLASVGFAVTLLSSGVLALLVRQGLHPINAVTQKLESIDENSLKERVSVAQIPSEVTPMVNRLNELLGRLDAAFLRERAFSSNLAHELRTPLAGLRSTLEVHLSRLHEPAEYQEAMSACLQICDQSQNLVENLLSLARLEGETVACHYEAVDHLEVFKQCWNALKAEAKQKHIEIHFDLPPLVLRTDRELLRVALRNVLSNAVSYCNEGGEISASQSVEDRGWVLRVSNTGNRLSKEDAKHVFDRLWRGDVARAKTGEHFGLGLSLTKRIVEVLGGSIAVRVDERFHITLTLPV